jgi:hypothetical protein
MPLAGTATYVLLALVAGSWLGIKLAFNPSASEDCGCQAITRLASQSIAG